MVSAVLGLSSLLASAGTNPLNRTTERFGLLPFSPNERAARRIRITKAASEDNLVPLVVGDDSYVAIRLRLVRMPNVDYSLPFYGPYDSRSEDATYIVGRPGRTPDVRSDEDLRLSLEIGGVPVPTKYASMSVRSSESRIESSESHRLTSARNDRRNRSSQDSWKDPIPPVQTVTRVASYRANTLDRDFVFKLPSGLGSKTAIIAKIQLNGASYQAKWTLAEFRNYRSIISGTR